MKFHTLNKLQAGATLMEVLIAMSISLVVTSAMIALMANSLGSTARIIQMTKLSDDLRVTMQMMTRDVRRSNYNANSMLCFANENCDDDGSVTSAGDIRLVDSDSDGVNDCFWYLSDREHDNYGSDIAAGGFRRVLSDPDGDGEFVGVIQMWTGSGDPEDQAICADAENAAGWVLITDPTSLDISDFLVEDDNDAHDLSYSQVILDATSGETLTQRVRKVRLNIRGQLVLDDSIARTLEDIIAVRNDLLL